MKKKRLRPESALMLGFLAIILLGSILLSLPISHLEGAEVSYLDSLFVSVSAVCVTGLSTLDVSASFNLFGRIVLLLLIQVGGLGFASFAVFLISILHRNISYSSRTLASDALNAESGMSVISLVKIVVVYALAIEILGGVFLTFPYLQRTESFLEALGMGLFHSISAFNNAGFDLNGDSLASFRSDVYVNIVVAVLILLGGLGFSVMSDILHHRKWSRFSFHTRIVLLMSFSLVFGGMALLCLSGMGALDAFFLSVSSRTAGFATAPLEELSAAALVVTLVLMFIGANPGSTGGGVKTTTIFVLLLVVRSVASGKAPSAFKRRIPTSSILKAFTVVLCAFLAILTGVFLLLLFEGDSVTPIRIVFEVVSAAATVGLSISLTPTLCVGSKVVIMVLMFIGRLGPLTIASFLTGQKEEHLEYLEEHVLIG